MKDGKGDGMAMTVAGGRVVVWRWGVCLSRCEFRERDSVRREGGERGTECLDVAECVR